MRKLIFFLLIVVQVPFCYAQQDAVAFSYQLASGITLGQFIDELKHEEEKTGEIIEGLDEVCKAKEDGAVGLSYEQVRMLIPAIISKVAPELLEADDDDYFNYDDMIKRAKRIQDSCDERVNADTICPVTKKPSISIVITLLSLLGKDLDSYCQKLDDKMEEVLESITRCCQSLSNQIAEIDEQYDQFPIVSLPFTVNKPGTYVLMGVDYTWRDKARHTFSGDTAAITIEADNVTLDLQGLTLTGATSLGIKVASVKNVTVKNGSLQGFQQAFLAHESSHIKLVDVHVCDAVCGFWFIDCNNSTCHACSAAHCTYNGFFFQGSCPESGFIQHHVPQFCPPEGLRAGNRFVCPKSLNRYNSCVECRVADCISDGCVYGFRSIYGFNNRFIKCLAQGLQTTDISNSSLAAAFFLGSARCEAPINYGVVPLAICEDTASEIIKCEVCDVTALKQSNPGELGGGRPVGIMLASHFDSNSFVLLNQENHGTQINALAWSARGCHLATGANLGDNIKIWRVNEDTGSLSLADVQNHGSELHAFAWSSDQCFLASGALTDRGQVKLWKAHDVTGSLTEIDAVDHGTVVRALAWCPNGCFLASCADEDGAQVRIWRFDKTLGVLTTVDAYEHLHEVFSAAWSPDGCFLITGAHDDYTDTLKVWKVAQDTGLLTLVDTYIIPGLLNALAWSPDGCFLATAISELEGYIKIWKVDTTSGQLYPSSSVSVGLVHALAWSPEGNFLAGGITGLSEQLLVWEFDRTSGGLNQIASAEHGSSVRALSWSSTGSFLASGASAESTNAQGSDQAAGQVHIRSSGIIYPKKSIIRDNKISGVSGGNGGFGIIGGCDNLIIKNVVYNTHIGFAGMNPLYRNGLYGTPGFFDNVQLPPFCLPCGVCRATPCS